MCGDRDSTGLIIRFSLYCYSVPTHIIRISPGLVREGISWRVCAVACESASRRGMCDVHEVRVCGGRCMGEGRVMMGDGV